ncbi:MAG: PAS domain S-box protein, partial [Methylophaga sp.]|nr:PAS domain S-box protein [Methylophaga sp.]
MDYFMFKSWSIRNLLQLWSLATILAIIVIASVAIYTNNVFSDTQNNLTDNVLPMEDASRQINAISFSFITRQKQIIASSSLEEINAIIPRKYLENEFSQQWHNMLESVGENEQGLDIVTSLQDNYLRFLDVDSQLLGLMRGQHGLRSQLQLQTATVEQLEQKIQNQVEAISGRINLQVSRNKRAIRLSLIKDNSESYMHNAIFSEQDSIQKLSQSVRLNVLNISYLTQNLLQSNNADNLLSIRDNDIRQHESILQADITQLKGKLQFDSELFTMTEVLEHDILELMRIVVEGQSAIYNLRLKQLQNNQLLMLGQQHSISILKIITAKLNQISSLVSGQSLQTVNQSVVVAERARWVIIILSILITLGMVRFIISISQRINIPLSELRSAMHALSSEEFDTRLKIRTGKSEFGVLATDFNLFADNTQNLMDDLADAKDSLQVREQHISAILNGVPEAILTLNSSGIIQSINPAAERVLQANKKTIVGLNLARFFEEQQGVSSLEDIERLLDDGKEFDGLDYNNRPFSMWLSLNVISDANDGLWVCVISDITAWKRAEEDLKTTSSELDTILENAMVGIAFIKERTLQRVNHKFEQLFGYDREDIEGESSQCLYLTEDAFTQIGDQAYTILKTGESFEGEVQLVRQNGDAFWCSLSSKAISAERPQDGSIWLFEDVTLQREKDEKLLNLASLDSLTSLPNR